VLLLGAPATAVSIDWVTVGNPGNACETQPQGCFGDVADVYRISKYEVTNAQYAEFLNAVAATTDTNGLYNPLMGSGRGGITQTPIVGGFNYSPITGRGNMPVNYVSFYDALRFANWMNNGQLAGAPGAASTEFGAYIITQSGITNNTITRNAGATIFLTSEDEWYKAAYHDALDTCVGPYCDYPARLDALTACTAPPDATPNRARCNSGAAGDVTNVGSYTGSASPYGTFDQGGNVWEWNEAIVGLDRGARGGSYQNVPSRLGAAERFDTFPTVEGDHIGLRVATSIIPEPTTGLLVIASLLGLAAWRRVRA
jgi:sulfatase modifying factor 1